MAGRRQQSLCLSQVWTDATTSSYQSVLCQTDVDGVWTPLLILIVYSRLDTGIQSVTEMLPLETVHNQVK